MEAFYRGPHFLDHSAKWKQLTGLGTFCQQRVRWRGACGTGMPSSLTLRKKEEDREKDAPALLCSPGAYELSRKRIEPWGAPTGARGRSPSISREGEEPRATLIPLREANDSWPGLSAMMSPSTSRLTGRLTRCPSL